MVEFEPSDRGPAAAARRGWAFVRFVLSLPLLALLWGYRRFVSPVLPPACRYYPSCSQYAEEAVRARGPLSGSALALWRLLRCHPWAAGGFDPVPLIPGGASPSGPVLPRPISGDSVPPPSEAGATAQRTA
jgi:putative membrane protein insertion efficiency factor